MKAKKARKEKHDRATVREVMAQLDRLAMAKSVGLETVRYAVNRWLGTGHRERAALLKAQKELRAKMSEVSRRLAVAFVFALVSVGVAQAGERHEERGGCVIARIEVQARRQVVTGLYHLTAVYRAQDGRELSQQACPDQNQPSWGNISWGPEDRVLDRFGFELLVRFQPGPVAFTVSTTQGHFVGAPDPVKPFVVILAQRSFVAR